MIYVCKNSAEIDILSLETLGSSASEFVEREEPRHQLVLLSSGATCLSDQETLSTA